MKSKQLSFSELVDREATCLARDILESHLQKLNLPLPKESALDLHIEQILKSNSNIRLQAKERVLAQKDAFSESLKAIGLSPPDLAIPIDIEL